MTANTKDNPGCLARLFPFLRNRKKQSFSGNPIYLIFPETIPYRLRDDFLSPAEFSFYKVLTSLTGTRLTIQSKVRLADIFFVARPNENKRYFGKIAQKHLDFLLCDSQSMRPVLGIELDDSSHNRSDRQERDRFVDDVFQAASLPLLHVPVRHEYNSREIASLIGPLIRDKLDIPPISSQVEKASVQSNSIPLCPKCDIPLVLRTVAQGEHKGKQFYGCQNYPHCREMKPVPSRIKTG